MGSNMLKTQKHGENFTWREQEWQ